MIFALEGLTCIVLAYPLAAGVATLGGWLGATVAVQSQLRPTHLVVLLAALPLLIGAESRQSSAPLREVISTLEIEAPPEKVWPHVVGFTELPAPSRWVFKLGIAYPKHARIDGHGPGALRYCEFSTGPFVEPITRWEEPTRLSFDVIEQPQPMEEWSPYQTVHAPHLLDGFQARRGEFRLIALPNNRTRLEGSTWYELDLFPQLYWTLWSDTLIHSIHDRVLTHVKNLVENTPG